MTASPNVQPVSSANTPVEIIKDARDYTDVFGKENATPEKLKDIYREFARVIHPDRGGDTTLFQLLNKYRAEADQALAEGRFGQPLVLATIRTKKAVHEVKFRVVDGDIATLYETNTGLLKVARHARDNDLMAQEAKALKLLHDKPHELTRHYPQLADTFLYHEGRRRANVLTQFDWVLSLEQLKHSFPEGLDPRHMVWIFRRVLMALGHAHDQGLVHGAVLPPHILIHPRFRYVFLVDWCYSVVIVGETKTSDQAIKAVVPVYKDWYPNEVLSKKPVIPSTDLYLAARTMMSLGHQKFPRPLQAFFRGVTLTVPSMRPQNAWQLLKEFDDLLKTMGHPYYPRSYTELVV